MARIDQSGAPGVPAKELSRASTDEWPPAPIRPPRESTLCRNFSPCRMTASVAADVVNTVAEDKEIGGRVLRLPYEAREVERTTLALSDAISAIGLADYA